MTYTFKLLGMTCGSCEAKVKKSLFSVNNVTAVEVFKNKNSVIITMERIISLQELQNALDDKYQIAASQSNESIEKPSSWLSTYKPVLLIFLYLFSITTLVELLAETIDVSRWLRHFMSGFFLVFSFFKMLNLKGFKNSYLMYDIIAKRFPFWGYVYPFIELVLGISFLVNFNSVITNIVTLIVMSLSIIGVLKSVLSNKTIKCACLGDVFNLPMSTVTIIEDGLMIVMSLVMLYFSVG